MPAAVASHTYRALLSWSGAAAGRTTNIVSYSRAYTITAPGKPVLHGSADPHFRGDAALYNPEELLVAALSACHMLSYLALCARGGISVASYEDSAEGTMKLASGKMRFTDVLLRPRCEVAGHLDLARALHERAHEECFIANSVNFPVRNEPVILPAE